MFLEILLGASLGLILRVVYIRFLFIPHPAARYVLLAPLTVIAGAVVTLLIEGAAQAIHRRRAARPIHERAFGVSLFLSSVLLIEIDKIAGEWGPASQTAAQVAAPFACALIALLWIRFRRFSSLAKRA